MSKQNRATTQAPTPPETAHGAEEAVHKALEFYRKNIEPNGKAIFAGLAILCAVLIVVNVAGARRRAAAAAGFTALSRAEDVSDYYDLARTYKGTPAGMLAGLQAAHKLYEEGSYKEAGARYELAAASADPEVAGRARLGQAYCLEAQGDAAKAGPLFEQVAGSATAWEIKVDACLGAGRAARLQGNEEGAVAWYEKAREAAATDETGVTKSRVRDALATLKMYRLASPAPAPAPAEDAEKAGDASEAGAGGE